ncbi:uncharacterized protein LOC128682240 isoform X2 [Plodia interpunctella]|uniref:uncharacterized protein LOC128682240 isoform X2 n=1 Tax=Plodia interpunctella TaxID=58824 RepID=UPI0031018802
MSHSMTQTQRRSLEASSEASYCEREPWDDWGSRSSLSQVDEVASNTSGEDINSLRAERDSLARTLAAERQRAAAAARAHDARLAELHGVIAELVRRRAQDNQSRAIPEEEVSDECESTTQPAGEVDIDADRSRTEQNSSVLSGEREKETPDEGQRLPCVEVSPAGDCDTSLDLSERDSDVCLSTARCCEFARVSDSSCDRDHDAACAPSPGRCEFRQAKLASRVRLRRTTGVVDADESDVTSDEAWCEEAERLALDVCAQADLREAAVAAGNDDEWSPRHGVRRTHCARLHADRRVLQRALRHAADTAHRLYSACAVHESRLTCVCSALKASDRALEAYDVLLALAETREGQPERAAAELVGRQLLSRLENSRAALGEPLLSPGPWAQHTQYVAAGEDAWSAAAERRLRAAAAALKAESVALRRRQPAPGFYSHHEIDMTDIPKPEGAFDMADMEAAVMMQEVLTAREAKAIALARNERAREHRAEHAREHIEQKSESSRRSKRKPRTHWLHTQPSETQL